MADKHDPKAPPVTGTRRRGIDTPVPIDVELTDSEVNHYRAFDVPFEVRKQWMAAKLPALDPQVLQDKPTPDAQIPQLDAEVNPPASPAVDLTATAMLYSFGNVAEAPETPPKPPDSAGAELVPSDGAGVELIPPLPRNRPGRAVVLLGAGLVVLLGVALYSLRAQDSGVSPGAATSEATPITTQATEPPPIRNANVPPAVSPPQQINSGSSNVPPLPSALVPPGNTQSHTPDESLQVPRSAKKGTPVSGTGEHRASTTKPADHPASTTTPLPETAVPVPPQATVPTSAPTAPSPVQSSWFRP